MSSPAVSIIVPVHDAQDFLAECLASIERQTLENIEVICVNDASTDESRDIIEAFASQDARFKLLDLARNLGVSAARNAGMDAAQGEYVMFMDADDWYPADTTVEHLYNAAKSHGMAIAAGETTEVDMESGRLRTDFRDDEHLHIYNFDREGVVEYREWQGDFRFTSFIFLRQLLTKNAIRFPDLVRHEDPVFLVKALLAAGSFYAIPEPVYRYRVNYKGATERRLSQQALDDAVEAHLQLLMLAEENDLQQLRSLVVKSLRWYLATQSPEAYAAVDEVYNSHSYRLGDCLLGPVRVVQKALRSATGALGSRRR